MPDPNRTEPSLRHLYAGQAKPRKVSPEALVDQGLGLVKSKHAIPIDQAFTQFPEAMNDRAFGPGTWTRREDPQPGLLRIRVDLPFYAGVYLWEFLFPETGQVVWILEGPDRAQVLDGTAETLKLANQSFSLHLSLESVAGYLRFCFATTPSDQWQGFLVDAPDHPVWAKHWAHRKNLQELQDWLYPPLVEEEEGGFFVEVSELIHLDYCETAYHVHADGTFERDDFLAWKDTEKLAQNEVERALSLNKDQDAQGAVEALTSAMRILDATEADGVLKRPDLLAETLLLRAQIVEDQGPKEALLPDLNRVVEILESNPQGHQPTNNLPKAYLLRGRALHAAGETGSALWDLWRSGANPPLNAWTWDPFHHGLAEMNDRTFGPGAWSLETDKEALLDSYRSYRIRLPFYPGATLWQVVPRLRYSTRPTVWALDESRRLILLDGTSGPVFQANERLHLVIDAGTVVPYLKFFCTMVQGDEGPFYVVEDEKHPLVVYYGPAIGPGVERIGPAIGEPRGAAWKVVASLLYGEKLFRATFQITRDGAVFMTDEETL